MPGPGGADGPSRRSVLAGKFLVTDTAEERTDKDDKRELLSAAAAQEEEARAFSAAMNSAVRGFQDSIVENARKSKRWKEHVDKKRADMYELNRQAKPDISKALRNAKLASHTAYLMMDLGTQQLRNRGRIRGRRSEAYLRACCDRTVELGERLQQRDGVIPLRPLDSTLCRVADKMLNSTRRVRDVVCEAIRRDDRASNAAIYTFDYYVDPDAQLPPLPDPPRYADDDFSDDSDPDANRRIPTDILFLN